MFKCVIIYVERLVIQVPRRMTQSEFIEKSIKKHGDKYDYSLVEYINATSKVEIICNRCGNHFFQLAGNHLKGKGCRSCSLSQVDTRLKRQQEFIDKAKHVHGDKYDYSFVNYVNNRTSVDVKCNMCLKMIKINPSAHLDGCDCRCQQKSKIEQTSFNRFGVTNAMLNPVISLKVQETNLKKYGAKFYTSTKEFREKSYETLMLKYGVDHISKSSFYDENKDAIISKIHASMKANGSYDYSKSEEIFYLKLASFFGENDVKRQYKSNEYPYNCDFYIMSLDLYIEFNGHWTHGDRFYNDDELYTQLFMTRLNSNTGSYYKKAKYVFSKLDVDKYMVAKQNGLNYLVFWDNDMRDVDVWLASGAPVGHDYGIMYSWLPNRKFKPTIVDFTGTNLNISKFVQMVNFNVFNGREIKLWFKNDQYKGLTLQMFLYHNRLKYLNKNPFELTDFEMLRAFTISGVLKRYSRFDNELMLKVLDKYDVNSIYDPFAGWGERAITASNLGIKYNGVDINLGLTDGYRILNDFSETSNLVIADSREYIPNHCDMVLSCPPYYDIEKYSDSGIENLMDTEFDDAFLTIVDNFLKANPKFVCFQVSSKHILKFETMLGLKGLHKIDEFRFDTIKGSHLNYKNGQNNKTAYEVMLVFRNEV